MSPPGFKSNLTITHIGTATAILEIDGVTFLTDPFFTPAGGAWDFGDGIFLKNNDDPAMKLENLPPIDAVLLSHEDHVDNLDELGRQLLDGRHVFTTMDGAKKLAPRPGVVGMKPWETIERRFGGKLFQILATPCVHLPGGESTGFVLTTEDFGVHPDGRPNAIYFTGDTIYIEELTKIAEKFHVVTAIMNIGQASVPLPDGLIQVTMDGKQAARLHRDIKADLLVPMHYESWAHFAQPVNELKQDFVDEGVSDQVKWLVPGERVKIL